MSVLKTGLWVCAGLVAVGLVSGGGDGKSPAAPKSVGSVLDAGAARVGDALGDGVDRAARGAGAGIAGAAGGSDVLKAAAGVGALGAGARFAQRFKGGGEDTPSATPGTSGPTKTSATEPPATTTTSEPKPPATTTKTAAPRTVTIPTQQGWWTNPTADPLASPWAH